MRLFDCLLYSGPAEPREPANPGEPAESVEPAEPIELAEPTEPMELVLLRFLQQQPARAVVRQRRSTGRTAA